MTVQKASGVLKAAYLVHDRADSLRRQLGRHKLRWSNIHVANLLDDLADQLKGAAVLERDQSD